MQIKTKAESEQGKVEIIFTNDEMNNDNYIDIVIGDEEYTISIDDLYHISTLFMKVAWDRRKENE
jgi:hypothetical protein